MSFYRLLWHQPKFHQFCPKNWPEIIWNFCVIRLLYQVSAHNLITHLISFEELSYVDCQNVAQIFNKDQSIHFTNKPFRVVEIIGIRKDAIHEPRPDHQLGFFFVCDKMLFQICTHLTINELIFHWAQCWSVSTRWSKVDHCEIWSFVKCGFLPSSCISQFVIMEIIYRHYKLKIEHFSHFTWVRSQTSEHVLNVGSICH